MVLMVLVVLVVVCLIVAEVSYVRPLALGRGLQSRSEVNERWMLLKLLAASPAALPTPSTGNRTRLCSGLRAASSTSASPGGRPASACRRVGRSSCDGARSDSGSVCGVHGACRVGPASRGARAGASGGVGVGRGCSSSPPLRGACRAMTTTARRAGAYEACVSARFCCRPRARGWLPFPRLSCSPRFGRRPKRSKFGLLHARFQHCSLLHHKPIRFLWGDELFAVWDVLHCWHFLSRFLEFHEELLRVRTDLYD